MSASTSSYSSTSSFDARIMRLTKLDDDVDSIAIGPNLRSKEKALLEVHQRKCADAMATKGQVGLFVQLDELVLEPGLQDVPPKSTSLVLLVPAVRPGAVW